MIKISLDYEKGKKANPVIEIVPTGKNDVEKLAMMLSLLKRGTLATFLLEQATKDLSAKEYTTLLTFYTAIEDYQKKLDAKLTSRKEIDKALTPVVDNLIL